MACIWLNKDNTCNNDECKFMGLTVDIADCGECAYRELFEEEDVI